MGESRYLRELVDFTHLQVFKESDATTYTCLVILGKPQGEGLVRLARVTKLDEQGTQLAEMPKVGEWDADGVRIRYMPAERLSPEPWVPVFEDERTVMQRMEENSIPLGEDGVGAHIFVGIQTSADDIYILDYRGEEGNDYIVLSRAAELGDRPLRIEKGILKPLLSGEDVKGYGAPSLRQLLLFPYNIVQEKTKHGVENKARLIPWEELETRYPNAASYLKEWEVTLRGREKGKMDREGWYGYNYPKNMAIQEGRKLVVSSLVQRFKVMLDDDGGFTLDNVNAIGIRLPFKKEAYRPYLALLNSSLVDWHLRAISTPFRGGFYQPNKQFLDCIPVPRVLAKGDFDTETGSKLTELSLALESLVADRAKLCTDFKVFVQGFARDRAVGDVLKTTKPRDKKVMDNAVVSQKLRLVRRLGARLDAGWLVLRPTLRDAVTGEEYETDIYRLRVPEPTAGLLLRFLPTLGPQDFSTAGGLSVLAKIERASIPNGSEAEIQAAIAAFDRERAEAERLDSAISNAQAEVDHICADLYGLLPEHLAIIGLDGGKH